MKKPFSRRSAPGSAARGLIAHALDTGSGLLDEGDAVEQVGNEGIAADALPAEVGKLHPLGQAAGAGDLDPVGIDLYENIGPLHEPVAMHDRIGDGFAQGFHRDIPGRPPGAALQCGRPCGCCAR